MRKKGFRLKDLITTLRGKFDESRAEKSKYGIRWSKIAKLLGVNDPMAVLGYAGINNQKQATEYFSLDSDVYDPVATDTAFTLTNYTISMLFGGKKKFDIKAINPEDQGYYNAATTIANKQINSPRSHFNFATYQAFGSSIIPFGNGGYMIKFDKEEKQIKFDAVGAADGFPMEGKYGEINVLFAIQNITKAEFTRTFGVDIDGEMKEKWADQDGVVKDIVLVSCITENPDYVKGAKGRNGQKYLQVFWTDCESVWHDVRHFNTKRFVYNRTMVMRGELFGRGYFDRALSAIDSANELTRLADESAERMVHPAIGIMAELNGDSVINLQPDSVTVITPMPGQNGTPVHTMQPIGDPSAVLKVSLDRYDRHIPQSVGLSAFLDVNTSAMTDRQTLESIVSRNKNLLPVYLGYREQILIPLFEAIVDLCIEEGLVKYDGKKAQGGYEIIPLNTMEEVYTTNVLNRVMELNNLAVALQPVIPDLRMVFDTLDLVGDAVEGSKYDARRLSKEKSMERIEAYYAQKAAEMQMGNGGSMPNETPEKGKAETDVEAAQGRI